MGFFQNHGIQMRKGTIIDKIYEPITMHGLCFVLMQANQLFWVNQGNLYTDWTLDDIQK